MLSLSMLYFWLFLLPGWVTLALLMCSSDKLKMVETVQC